MEAFDVVIVGAGAAGLMCAISAGRRGRRVLLLDHADQPGKKILISGGGRCNFTNRIVRPDNFLSDNPHFCPLGVGALPAGGFRRAGRPARHRLAREDAGSAFLRRLGATGRGHAAGRVRGGRGRAALRLRGHRHQPQRPLPHRDRDGHGDAAEPGARDRRPVDPEAGRHRLRASMSPPASGCRSRRCVRPWCRSPSTATTAAMMHALSGVALPVVATCGRTCVQRGRPVHPSRPVGPGDPADVVVLARQRADHAGSAAGRAAAAAGRQAVQAACAQARTVLGELLPARLAQALAERHLPAIAIGNGSPTAC